MRRAAIPGLVTLAVLRLPSLMEPHWYTDEAGYVNVARELLKGKILYSQTWNNKPPGMLWTIALEVQLFGSSVRSASISARSVSRRVFSSSMAL